MTDVLSFHSCVSRVANASERLQSATDELQNAKAAAVSLLITHLRGPSSEDRMRVARSYATDAEQVEQVYGAITFQAVKIALASGIAGGMNDELRASGSKAILVDAMQRCESAEKEIAFAKQLLDFALNSLACHPERKSKLEKEQEVVRKALRNAERAPLDPESYDRLTDIRNSVRQDTASEVFGGKRKRTNRSRSKSPSALGSSATATVSRKKKSSRRIGAGSRK